SGEVRFTTEQNLIIPNISDPGLRELTQEPLLKELPYNPPEILRGFVVCTGIDFCDLALIDTKARALPMTRALAARLADRKEPLASASGRGPGHGAAPRGRLRRLVRPRTSRRGPARLPRGHRGRLLRDRLPDERLLAPPAVGLLRPGAARGRTPPARAPPAARRGGTRPRGATLHRPALPGTLARPPAPLCRPARQLRDHAAA